jgi:hypothetical protein
MNARQLMKAFEILDDIAGIGAVAHVGDSQGMHQLRLGHELRIAHGIEFFVHDDLPGSYR